MVNAVSKHYNLYGFRILSQQFNGKKNDETTFFYCCLHSRPLLEGENRSWPVVSGHLPLNMRPPPFSLVLLVVVVSNSQESVEDTRQW